MSTEIRKPLKKLIPHLLKAQEDNLNEADTVQRIVMVLEQVLGYDRLTEITREKQVKDKYVDIALKIDGVIKLLLEAKAAGTVLRDRHIDQAKAYGAEGNIRWVVLTNGVVWNLYHLSFDDGLDYEKVFSVDLATDPIEKAEECLGVLHRQSVNRGRHEEFWDRHAALDAASIGRALYTDTVLRLTRREIRKRSGVLVDEEDLVTAIHGLLCQEARDKIGVAKIRRTRSPRAVKTGESPTAQATPVAAAASTPKAQ